MANGPAEELFTAVPPRRCRNLKYRKLLCPKLALTPGAMVLEHVFVDNDLSLVVALRLFH